MDTEGVRKFFNSLPGTTEQSMPFAAKLKHQLGSCASLGVAARQPQDHVVESRVVSSHGFCTTCGSETEFHSDDRWLRDHFLCATCRSIPRERALMAVIDDYFPHWRKLTVHESSPGARGASLRLKDQCPGYLASQCFPGVASGSSVGGVRCEDLEALSFEDESIDLHVTQDVMEHVLSPDRAFAEIARTLKPGGAHIFTTPLVHKHRASFVRARRRNDGSVEYLAEPVYHGNPIDQSGALVTVDWGYDICRTIFDACGLFTHVVLIDDLSRGIRAEYNEVLVTLKAEAAPEDRSA